MTFPTPQQVARVPVPGWLRALWARIPRVDCKGLCSGACGPWHASKAEVDLLRLAAPEATTPSSTTCPLLTPEGRCSAYRVRPLICRAWGGIESLADERQDDLMQCVHGCKVIGGQPLSTEEFLDLVREANRRGGGEDSLYRGSPCFLCGQPVEWPKVLHEACVLRDYGSASGTDYLTIQGTHPGASAPRDPRFAELHPER